MVARCYGFRKIQGWIVDEEKELAETRRLAMKVAAIGHDDERALASAGQSLAWVCKDYDVGEALVDQVLAINPNSAFCWRMRAYLSLYLGQHQAVAIDQISRVFRLNPLDPDIARSEGIMALACVFLGRYEDFDQMGHEGPCPTTALVAVHAHFRRWPCAGWQPRGSAAACGADAPAGSQHAHSQSSRILCVSPTGGRREADRRHAPRGAAGITAQRRRRHRVGQVCPRPITCGCETLRTGKPGRREEKRAVRHGRVG